MVANVHVLPCYRGLFRSQRLQPNSGIADVLGLDAELKKNIVLVHFQSRGRPFVAIGRQLYERVLTNFLVRWVDMIDRIVLHGTRALSHVI